MRLGSLKKLDELNINKEIKELKETNSSLKKLINNDNYLSNFLIDETKKINDNLSENIKLRRTKINNADDYELDIDIDEFTEIEKFTVLLQKIIF